VVYIDNINYSRITFMINSQVHKRSPPLVGKLDEITWRRYDVLAVLKEQGFGIGR
jgi:hypothetical protein